MLSRQGRSLEAVAASGRVIAPDLQDFLSVKLNNSHVYLQISMFSAKFDGKSGCYTVSLFFQNNFSG